MTGARGWLATRGARRALVAGALAVVAGYLVQRPVEVAVGSGVLDAAAFRDFWGSEGSYRWTRGRSEIVFPDPGPGVAGRVELDVAGWRPRGQEPPQATFDIGASGLMARPSARGETLRLTTVTTGWWTSDLAVRIESPTFTAGPQDPRALGIRVYAARFVPAGGAVALHRPPLGQVVTVALAVWLLFGLLSRVGVSPRAAAGAAWAAAALAALCFAFARPQAALLSRPLLLALAALAAIAHVAPHASATAAEALAAAARALGRGGRQVVTPAGLALAVAGAVALSWTYRARPSVEIDLGSGREVAVAEGFGPFDAHDGATFRAAQRGAQLDLRDFGSGPWTISVTASVASDVPSRIDLLRVGHEGLLVTLDEHWVTTPFDIVAPFGWRSGLVVYFPGSEARKARIDKVRIDRPHSLPSLRILAAGIGAALLLAAGFGAVGLPQRASMLAAALVLAAETTALATDPAIALPFVVPFCAIVAFGVAFIALAAGVVAVMGRRGAALLPSPAALVAAGVGVAAWLAATAFPLYRGGNFVFHSSIAEEIWKGRFLVYYLPYPGSMLSQQAQWGNIVVPHPCTEQTLLSPLAALPQPWFYLAEKAVAALWLGSMALMAALLATRVAGPSAGAWAAAAMASLVPTFQLLGLGHLMTLFGCWAASLAFTYLVFRLDRIGERRVFWTTAALLALCFLSYFASLLFGALVLVFVLVALVRRDPATARTLLLAALAAATAAFLLYYVNWAWPFLSQSVPKILAGSSRTAEEAGTPVLRRLLLEPHKLAYSYGAALVPLLALLALAARVRTRDRVVLLAWAGVLLAVSGVDLWFNFLLKHHYFVMVPTAVGLGLGLGWLAERGRAGRIAAAVAIVLLAALGAETGLAVALGLIP